MISDVDEALRKILTRDTAIGQYGIEIKYDQPNREWTARLNKPTINLFLFDIRENLKLRAAEQYSPKIREDGTVEVHRNVFRIDLRYLLTAWTKSPEDEHLLLSDALLCLLRNPYLPQDVLSDRLKAQPYPIPLETAVFQPEHGPEDKFTEIWSVLNNTIHAGFILIVTLSVDPFSPDIYSQVRSLDLHFEQEDSDNIEKTYPDSAHKTYKIGLRIKQNKYNYSTLQAVLAEKNLPLEIDSEGGIVAENLDAGKYHVDILYNGKVIKHQSIEVPDGNFDIEV